MHNDLERSAFPWNFHEATEFLSVGFGVPAVVVQVVGDKRVDGKLCISVFQVLKFFKVGVVSRFEKLVV